MAAPGNNSKTKVAMLIALSFQNFYCDRRYLEDLNHLFPDK